MRMTRGRIALAGAAAGLVAAAGVGSAATNVCGVAASVGFVNCINVSVPNLEQATAPNGSATPYKFQLWRSSDGARWGPWTWNDTNHHTVFLSLAGLITGQIDNQGSGTQSYTVTLDP
jgi:hypothetical protein